MKQYNEIKVRYPDALLLFRVRDFYETFGNDAVRSAGILGIVLASEVQEVRVKRACWISHHAKPISQNLQYRGESSHLRSIGGPKSNKKIGQKGVTELITPGVP